MSSKNNKTSNRHRLLLHLLDKIILKRSNKYVALSNLRIKVLKVLTLHRHNKFKISAPTWNDKFELHDGSYFVSDIQDYF